MILSLALAWADVTVPVQGVLTDANGVPLDGTFEVAFGVHTAEGAAAAYTEPMSVQFVAGMFSARIGVGTSVDDALWTSGGERWISLALAGQTPSTPVPVGAAPRAVRAMVADSADRLGTLAPADVALAGHGHAWSEITGVTSGTTWAGTVPWARVTGQPHTYTDGEISSLAVTAMGAKSNSNPLNHDRYTDTEAVAAVTTSFGAKANSNPRNHDRYTDAEAVAAVTTSFGAKDNTNPRNHDRYTDAEAVTAVTTAFGAKANTNPRNHDRYTDTEAVAAVTSSFGAKSNTNPRNHDRYTDLEASKAAGGNMVRNFAMIGTTGWIDGAETVRDRRPDGSDGQVHRSVEVGTSCYNWAFSSLMEIDPARGYEFSIWVRSTQSDLANYFGYHVYDDAGNQISGAWNNPYFKTNSNDPNTWQKWTGHLMAHTTPDANADGLPDSTNERTNGTDWKMPSNAKYAVIRFGTCYGNGVGSGETFYSTPSVRELQDESGPWMTPTFAGTWTNYSGTYNPAGFYKDDDGFVHLRGLVAGGSGTIFTLPTGYRPQYRELHGVATNPNTIGRVDIDPAGNVFMDAGSASWISLDGITFRVAGY